MCNKRVNIFCVYVAPYSYASDVRIYQWKPYRHLCDKFRYQNRPHYQFIGKGITHIEMYLWYPLIAVQWNRCNQHSRLTFIYLLKGTRQNSGMWNVRTWPVSPIFLENTLHEVCLIPNPDFRKSELLFMMRIIFSLDWIHLVWKSSFCALLYMSKINYQYNLLQSISIWKQNSFM